MTRRRCVLDASVLYQEVVRNLLLWVASEGGLDPFWTERILGEAQRNLIEAGVVSPMRWERLRAAMLTAFPDATLDQAGADAIESRMPNDRKDRHVLAAAVAHGVGLIVTNNLKHFKQVDLDPVGVRAINPDRFFCELLSTTPEIVRQALNRQAAAMRTPRQWTVEELLGRLAGLGHGEPLLPQFAEAATGRFGIEPTPPPKSS